MSIPTICIALLALLTIMLGFVVSAGRGKFNTLSGSETDPENKLYHLVRAHGNTTEYAPILALLIYILSLGQPAAWVLWFMILATAARFIFAFSLIFASTLAKPSPGRFIGASGTYFFGAGLGIALLMQGFGL